MAQLQVLAGTGGVVLGSQRVLHLLDLQLEGVERAKDLLHAIVVILIVGIVLHQLAGVDVPLGTLGRAHYRQRMDDIAGGTL